ncbi:D-alanyl-D-alanine carboxypeptidase family protein [Miltoncostaea marina]|uniref:D-alanyl-D-alanine carboxypeptidase family protein n=1 Tax=Miltoncostaea marina TaxID=2843215 RepID=UPI001C3CF59E|nr:D-alanyl-D-alanine carboxypeptidase family protein [Miltoncostaea marina]
MLRRLAIIVVLASVVAAPAAAAPAPEVAAAAYILVNPRTGETLAQRAPDRELAMASTTKIMTALVVLDEAGLDEEYTVPRAAVEIGGSSAGLVAGERLSVRDLLTGLLVASGNDAGLTLAQGVAGSEAAFVELMNARARRMGLAHTRFHNAHGLDAPGHHSSVSDLIRLGRVAMRDPVFRAIVASRRATIPGPRGAGVRELVSENLLLDLDPGADGVKTGMTNDAGYAIVARSRRPALGVTLYAAMIGSPSGEQRAQDTKRLLDWGFAQYARATLLPAGAIVGEAPVDDAPGVRVPYRPDRPLSAPIRLGQPLTETIVAPTEVRAPVSAGEVIGTITMRQGGRVVGRRDLVAVRGAAEPGFLDRLRAGVESLLP